MRTETMVAASLAFDPSHDAWNRLVQVEENVNTRYVFAYLCPCQLAGVDFSPPRWVSGGCFSGGWGPVVARALGFFFAV
jgi:hypothetical protein